MPASLQTSKIENQPRHPFETRQIFVTIQIMVNNQFSVSLRLNNRQFIREHHHRPTPSFMKINLEFSSEQKFFSNSSLLIFPSAAIKANKKNNFHLIMHEKINYENFCMARSLRESILKLHKIKPRKASR